MSFSAWPKRLSHSDVHRVYCVGHDYTVDGASCIWCYCCWLIKSCCFIFVLILSSFVLAAQCKHCSLGLYSFQWLCSQSKNAMHLHRKWFALENIMLPMFKVNFVFCKLYVWPLFFSPYIRVCHSNIIKRFICANYLFLGQKYFKCMRNAPKKGRLTCLYL